MLAQTASGQSSSIASPVPTVQAQFEQASAALAARQWDSAAAGFREIDGRPKLSPRTRGVVRMREGIALYHLGRDEAAETLREGLKLAPAADRELGDDRAEALLTLGAIERADFDFAAARREFEAARSASDNPVFQISALMALTEVGMFEKDGAAVGYADELLTFIGAHKVDAAIDGQVHDLRGRVLLNRGNVAGAIAELTVALKDFGGLTSKSDINDVRVRSDLALAYLLDNKKDKAQEFLGMTGAGRVPDDAMLPKPVDGNLPPCGADIAPDDVAVVEFTLGENGAVQNAIPIYASRAGGLAVEFARAVYDWSWDPARIKTVPLFYRAAIRVELRCTTAVDRPSPLDLLEGDVKAWLHGAGSEAVAPNESEARRAERLRARLAERGDRPDDLSTVPLLLDLAHSRGSTFREQHDLYARADHVAAEAHAPLSVRTYFAIHMAKPPSDRRRDRDAAVAALEGLLQRPEVAGDARSAATLHLIIAQQKAFREPAVAAKHLEDITADAKLEAHDPLRIGALLQLATLKARQNDLAQARHYYDLTGLTAQQCALVDAQPIRVRGQATESDYPLEARQWGLSGWARTEFDVKPDGATTHVRTVAAYPPFVFGKPIEHVAERMKFTQSFRPDGGLGCGGQTFAQSFHYVTH
jgi:tetratricopeptide (TPR) repeat protein